jgi:hypothetical protein
MDPEHLHEVISAYQKCVADIVAKYMGDGIPTALSGANSQRSLRPPIKQSIPLSPNIISELAPTGALRAGINLSNFLLVTKVNSTGIPRA